VLSRQICPFWNPKETGEKVCNPVSHRSALRCFALLHSAYRTPPPPRWLSAVSKGIQSWAGAEPRVSPAQTWPLRAISSSSARRRAFIGSTAKLQQLIFQQRCTGRQQGKIFWTGNPRFKGWRYFRLTNTTVTRCLHRRQNNACSPASFSEPVRHSLPGLQTNQTEAHRIHGKFQPKQFYLSKFWGITRRHVCKLKYTRHTNTQRWSSFLKATSGLSMHLLLANEMYHLSFKRQWEFSDQNQIKNPQGSVC